jgi:hypothetical protein
VFFSQTLFYVILGLHFWNQPQIPHRKKDFLKIQKYIHEGANLKLYIPEFFNYKLYTPESTYIELLVPTAAYFFFTVQVF